MRRWFIHATFALALALLVLPACTPSYSDAPTYKHDVQPIFIARCVRCHGANDTLNADPTIPFPVKMPLTCYLQRYEDEGDCSMVSTCKRGAGFCASMLVSNYIVHQPDDSTLRMPPFPADQLSDGEISMIQLWAKMSPPAP
ncbi:MAG TPA: hypothetical protein VIF57_19665 [Polyangia bacterium]|jgi:hypothetical protein